MFQIHMPHQNLNCLGISLFGRYMGDVSMPHRDYGWGRVINWTRLIQIYWRGADGRRHWLYLPSFQHHADRKEVAS